jgi:cysteine desulfurase
VAAAIEPQTALVSIMAANNEIGTLQPLGEIGALCRSRGVLFHSDAAQWLGKLPFAVDALQVDLASLSGHKLYAPKGVGALYVRRKGPRVQLSAQMHGGGHERGRRSGTLNVPGIVGLGAAAEIARSEMAAEAARLRELTLALEQGITTQLDGVRKNGHPHERLPGNLHLSFSGVEAEALMMSLRDVALSSGAACTSATLEPSHVLRAIGLSPEAAHGSLRFGLGRANTRAEVDSVARSIVDAVLKLRQLAEPRRVEVPVC